MTEPQTSNSPDCGEPPGKIRTMWHPMLVQLLSVVLGAKYKVEQEFNVGKAPLRVDIILIRQEGGELSDAIAAAFSTFLA